MGTRQSVLLAVSVFSMAAAGAQSSWSLGGNGGTDPSANFVGTSDYQPLIFRVNNGQAGLLGAWYNTAWGQGALLNGLSGNGQFNTAVGGSALGNNTGLANVASGFYALYSNTGNDNTASGTQSLQNNAGGSYNTASGYWSLLYNTTGSGNSAQGMQSLQNNTVGSNNTAMGYLSLFSNGNSNNTAIGASALYSNPGGSNNTAIGYMALNGNLGNNNTAIGAYADVPGNLSNATAIGSHATAVNNNTIVLGGTGDYLAKVGISTTDPKAPLHVAGNGTSKDAVGLFTGNMILQANTGGLDGTTGASLEFAIPDGNTVYGKGRIITLGGSSTAGDQTGMMVLGTKRYFNKLGTGNNAYYGDDLTIDGKGNVGIGTAAPQSRMHVLSQGSALAVANVPYTGDMVIQSNTAGGRSTVSGASLEFVIPANTGTGDPNPWGQARIIAVADNGATGDATGRMVLGTRRSTNGAWSYGNDLTIDGLGHVTVGNPASVAQNAYILNVWGNARVNKLTVNTTGADFVFGQGYRLRPLAEVERYVKANRHLPEVASAAEMEKNGTEVGEVQTKLLQKVEELTLYAIAQEKKQAAQEKLIAEQGSLLLEMGRELSDMKKAIRPSK